MNDLGPKPVGTPSRLVTLTGALIPWNDDRPVWLAMPGTADLYLPCFSAVERLRCTMARVAPFQRIKQIEDGQEFIASIPAVLDGTALKIILDPWFTIEGKVRYTEVFR